MLLASLTTLSFISITKAEEPKYGGTLRVATSGDPQTLGHAITTSFVPHLVSGQVFSALIKHDFDLNPLPELATSWEISADGLTYTFDLRDDVVWHDGENFTSADVKFTIDEVLIPFHPSGSQVFANLDEVETPDNYTVILHMNAPWAPLMKHLGKHYAAIFPKHLYEGTDILTNEYNTHPIGTGPFKFVEHVRGEYIRLARFEDYFIQGKPYLDEIIFEVIPDSQVQLIALENGEIDYLPVEVELSEATRVMELPGITTTTKEDWARPCVNFMMFNLREPPFDNLKVRQAIAHAIDKETLNERSTYGFETLTDTPFLPSQTDYYNPATIYEYDSSKAEQLLDEAGYPRVDGGWRFDMEVVTIATQAYSIKQSEIVAEMLRSVGINAYSFPMEAAAQIEKVYINWDYDVNVACFGAGPDPSVAIARLYHSDNIQRVPYQNFAGYNNSRVDELFDLALEEVDETVRAGYFHETQVELTRDLPAIWFSQNTHVGAWRDEFVGFPAGPWYAQQSWEDVYWTGGSEASPESAMSAIEEAESQIEGLKGWYYDVTPALDILNEAKEAYNAADYATAYTLAKSAAGSAIPPYAIIGSVVLIVCVVVIGSIWFWRKRRK